MSLSLYMNLSLPQVGVTAGPAWASQVNAAFSAVDLHDHSSGRGKPIRSASLSIDADLAFGGFNATALRSARFAAQGSPLALGTDVGCLYLSGGNLYFNSGSGQQVQITAGAALNAASIGAIGGDYGTSGASEVYVAASQTFQFFQAANKYASLDAGNVILREPGATSPKGITLKSPTGLAADYALKLPAALPGAQSFLTLDASGNVVAAAAYAGGITNAQQSFGTPSATTDVAIKSYVDGKVAIPGLTQLAPRWNPSGYFAFKTRLGETMMVGGAYYTSEAAPSLPSFDALPIGSRPLTTDRHFKVTGTIADHVLTIALDGSLTISPAASNGEIIYFDGVSFPV